MSITELRRNTKRRIDELPAAQVRTAARFVESLSASTATSGDSSRQPIMERLKRAKADIAAGRGVPVSKLKRKY